MRFIKSKRARILFLCIACVAILVIVPLMSTCEKSEKKESELVVLNIWEIDSFEGGKGSRAEYLRRTGERIENCYVKVTTISAAAARENLKSGNVPDLISYGAGTYGLEGYFTNKTPFSEWCRGGYCILCTDESADFSDITPKNTIVNGGTENRADVAAMLLSLGGAQKEKPTGAYVSLINGKFKYLLGTQRDIFRLKTRGVAFKVKPVTIFNDLYQLISVTAPSKEKIQIAREFVNILTQNKQNLTSIGMLGENCKIYDDEMREMEGIVCEYNIKTPISFDLKSQIDEAVKNNDENKIKSLLK